MGVLILVINLRICCGYFNLLVRLVCILFCVTVVVCFSVACFDYFSLVVVVCVCLVWFYYVGLLLNCFSLVFDFGVDWFGVMVDLFAWFMLFVCFSYLLRVGICYGYCCLVGCLRLRSMFAGWFSCFILCWSGTVYFCD